MNPPFKVVKKAIPEVHAKFLYEYQNVRYEATKHLYKNKLVQNNPIHGSFDNSPSTPGAFVLFGDPAFDLLMMNMLDTVKLESGDDLIPIISNARLYLKGHEIMATRGTGRSADNITAAIHLGHEGSVGDKLYSFFIQSPDGVVFQADLDVGDMVVYDGSSQKNWREPCEHDYYGQVMLQYGKSGTGRKMLDGRSHLGIPGGDYFGKFKKAGILR